jgi:hypothetical protein
MSDKIQLAVGYIGVTREGRRVEIVNCTQDTVYPWRGSNRETYTDCGSFSTNRNDFRDIIGPLVDLVNYNDGKWHRWGEGADCPVHENTLVEVSYINSDGDLEVGDMQAGLWMWNSTIELILAFRVTKEYAEPVKLREFWLVQGYFHSFDPGYEGAVHVREVLK